MKNCSQSPLSFRFALPTTTAMLILLVFPSVSVAAAKVPKRMLHNVAALTQASAVLDVCFRSPAYKALPSQRALKLHGLQIRLTDLVQKIASHYHDDALYTTYELMHFKMSSESSIIGYVKTRYHYCGKPLAKDMDAYVLENEHLIDAYFQDADASASGGTWPAAEKHAYIQRCASSMVSQGLSPPTGKSYCACIANGMEKEFGIQEYAQMMNAQPNPKGTSYDRRLYRVFKSCEYLLSDQ